MSLQGNQRRSIRHYHDPGDVHELTFSCYRRLPLLGNDSWRRLLAESVDRAMAGHRFALAAFVFMPDHVHLLAYPLGAKPSIDKLLYAIKRPYSHRVKQSLQAANSPLLGKLTVATRQPGAVFRFWQKGPGYDRNLKTADAVVSSIDYIHNNPVRRGLCEQAEMWKWSSARWYLSDGQQIQRDLPTIHGLPPGFVEE